MNRKSAALKEDVLRVSEMLAQVVVDYADMILHNDVNVGDLALIENHCTNLNVIFLRYRPNCGFEKEDTHDN